MKKTFHVFSCISCACKTGVHPMKKLYIFALMMAFLFTTAVADEEDPPPRGKSATINVITEPPNCEVYLGGELLIGKSPIENAQVKSGRQTIVVFYNGIELVNKLVNVWPGNDSRNNFDFTPKIPKGSIRITTNPPRCIIFVDGEQADPTDGAELVVHDLDAGGHMVRAQCGSSKSVEALVTVKAEKTAEVYLDASGREPRVKEHSVYIADAEHGTVIANVSEGQKVSLTVTPDDGYVLKDLVIEGCESNPLSYSGGWYSDNKFTFVMPNCDVSVTPVFKKGVEDAFLNMDQELKVVELPANVTTFKVYDDGGKNANHSNGVINSLELIAPEGYQFKLAGSITTGKNCAKLTVFDGDANADKLLNEKTSSYNQEKVDIGILYSSGNVMTLYFDGGSSTAGPGLDLEVSLLKSDFGAVNIAYSAAGTTAIINGKYNGNETLSIPEAIEVDAVDYDRELEVDIPVTAMLPVTLPEGATVNADFYTLEKVEQVAGMKWQATMTYIGKNNLPQPNTPYAVILPAGQTKLEFDLKGKKATVQTGEIKKVCGINTDCQYENGKITNDWFFTGTYAYKVWNDGDGELGLSYAFAATDNPDGAAKGKFGKIIAGGWGSAMRCYLRKRDADVKLQQQNPAQMVAASPYIARYSINNLPETIDVEFVKNDEKGGRTVLRGRMNTFTGEFKMLRDYDLKGRKVNSTNRARGAYYGKKVMKER